MTTATTTVPSQEILSALPCVTAKITKHGWVYPEPTGDFAVFVPVANARTIYRVANVWYVRWPGQAAHVANHHMM